MNLFKSQRGGITIFQCLVFTALLLLAGVIIDISRIMAAEKKVQSAVNASARSVLAGYNTDLMGDYGVFGLNTFAGGRTAENDFIRYLEANLGGNAESFRFIKYNVVRKGTSARGYGNLLDNDDNVLREQILKYMKYRVPLTVTENVIDKFMSSGIFRKKEFASREQRVRNERKKVKMNIGGINGNIKNANKRVQEIKTLNINESNIESYTSMLNQLKTHYLDADREMEAAEKSYNSYSSAISESAEFAEKANKNPELKGEAAIRVYDKEFNNVSAFINTSRPKVQSNLKKADMHLLQIEPLKKEIAGLVSQRQSLEAANIRLSLELKNAEDESGEAEEIKSRMEANNSSIAALQTGIDTKTGQIRSMRDAFDPEGMSEMEAGEAENNTEEAPKKEDRNDDSKLKELKDRMDKLLGDRKLDNSWLINSYELKNAIWEDREKMSRIMETPVLDSESDLNRAESENSSILSFLDKIKAAFEYGIENIYVVEYIMDRFTYHTSITERDHYFRKGEVEYVLWGNARQNLNIGYTMTGIGLIRFAVNAIDYFATSKVPHPVFRLVYAVGRGIAASCRDCYKLYSGKEIGICPTLNKSGFMLNYSDHLRVLLLLQAAANGEGQLNNVRQLIQVNLKKPGEDGQLENPDLKLADHDTILYCKAEVKINLWFIPLLQIDKMGFKNFEGGSYIIRKEIHTGY